MREITTRNKTRLDHLGQRHKPFPVIAVSPSTLVPSYAHRLKVIQPNIDFISLSGKHRHPKIQLLSQMLVRWSAGGNLSALLVLNREFGTCRRVNTGSKSSEESQNCFNVAQIRTHLNIRRAGNFTEDDGRACRHSNTRPQAMATVDRQDFSARNIASTIGFAQPGVTLRAARSPCAG